MTLASVSCMNVFIAALNSLMVQCGCCGTLVARYNRMSLKADPPAGEDGPKNQLQ